MWGITCQYGGATLLQQQWEEAGMRGVVGPKKSTPTLRGEAREGGKQPATGEERGPGLLLRRTVRLSRPAGQERARAERAGVEWSLSEERC